MILRKPRRARSPEQSPEGAWDTWVALGLILAVVLLVVIILALVAPAEASGVMP